MDTVEHFLKYNASLISFFNACGAIIGIIFIYWLFYIPCSWKKNLEDVGYGVILGEKKKSNVSSRKDDINRIRKLRKIGLKEIPPPYPNGWYSLLESSNLKRGESKSVSALGEQFVVFRTLGDSVHVLDAYCPHMGANLGAGGQVIGDAIECPFHKWRFHGSDGRCINVPYSTCGLPIAKVKKWVSCEINDTIFVWYHAEVNEEPWLIPVIQEIDSKEFVYHGRNEFYINCHIQEIPENGADFAHFKGIHNDIVLAGGEYTHNSIFKNAGRHHWQSFWKQSEPPTKYIARLTLSHFVELTKNIRLFKMDVEGEQIGPAYVQLHMNSPTMGRIEVLQTIIPIEPMVQKVIHRFYAPRILAPFVKFVILGESIMFERDMNIWNHKIFLKQPKLVKEEITVKLFRTWFSQFYSENSRSFSEAYETVEW